MKKFISTSLNDFLNEKHISSVELFKAKSKDIMKNIEGRFLNKGQAEELQREIESNYTTGIKFGKDNKDIRTNLFNYEHPIAQKNLNGVDLRIAEGLIRDGRKTYLLYADGKIIGEFYAVSDIKNIIKYIEDNIIHKKIHENTTDEIISTYGFSYIKKKSDKGETFYDVINNFIKIGMIEFHSIDNNYIEIDRIYLNKEQQKKGFGQKIICDILIHTKADGFILYPLENSVWIKMGLIFIEGNYPYMTISRKDFFNVNSNKLKN